MVARFATRLEPWQAAVVRHVILQQQDWRRYWQRRCASIKHPLYLPPFSHLRRLTIIVQLVVEKSKSWYHNQHRPDLDCEDCQDDMVAEMEDLATATLHSVDVAIVVIECQFVRADETSFPAADMSRLEAWASRIQSLMLKKSQLN